MKQGPENQQEKSTKPIGKINKTKNCFFEKMNKTNFSKEKNGNKMRNERKENYK